MNISIIGTGYVGLVTGTCLAEMGNIVTFIDNNKDKVRELSKGIIPIYEPNLESMVKNNCKHQRLSFTTDFEETIKNNQILFIAVGTPMGEDGGADLSHVLDVATKIGQYMASHTYIVNKSTVPVGTADKVRTIVQGELDKRLSDLTFDVISNPEFLKEGSAVADFMKPDRIIIGGDNSVATDLIKSIYLPFVDKEESIITMDVKSSEMTKYAANAMLATKISFINEISNICELVGADTNQVRVGIGSDSRIGNKFINPGCGYGGSCFPKDIKALVKTAEENNYKPILLESVEDVNNKQKQILGKKIKERFGANLEGKTFGIWGLSFKPETDDMRDASSVTLIKELTKSGAQVKVYDPKAMKQAEEHYLKEMEGVNYCTNKYDTLNNSDAMVLVTEWKEFTSPDFEEMGLRLKNKIIFDGRNQYNITQLRNLEFECYQIGVKQKNSLTGNLK